MQTRAVPLSTDPWLSKFMFQSIRKSNFTVLQHRYQRVWTLSNRLQHLLSEIFLICKIVLPCLSQGRKVSWLLTLKGSTFVCQEGLECIDLLLIRHSQWSTSVARGCLLRLTEVLVGTIPGCCRTQQHSVVPVLTWKGESKRLLLLPRLPCNTSLNEPWYGIYFLFLFTRKQLN